MEFHQNQNFHGICIMIEMSFMKWAHGSTSPLNAELIWGVKWQVIIEHLSNDTLPPVEGVIFNQDTP